MVSWPAGRELPATSHGHGGVILVATSRGQWNLYHQTTKFRSWFAAVNTSLRREWQPALLLLFCSPPVLWSGLAHAVYRVLGLVHLLVNRCPQWPCLQNCNKLTTGLSGVTSQITHIRPSWNNVFVGRNLWIGDIHGSACAIYGSILCAEIHGCLRNLWILRRMQIISL